MKGVDATIAPTRSAPRRVPMGCIWPTNETVILLRPTPVMVVISKCPIIDALVKRPPPIPAREPLRSMTKRVILFGFTPAYLAANGLIPDTLIEYPIVVYQSTK